MYSVPDWQIVSYTTLQDLLSAESGTVVEMPISVLKPVSYTGNKPPEMTMDACDKKSMTSVQSDVSVIPYFPLDLSMSFIPRISLHIL